MGGMCWVGMAGGGGGGGGGGVCVDLRLGLGAGFVLRVVVVAEAGERAVVGDAATAARGERALDGEDHGVVLVGGVQEEDGALPAGHDVGGGDVRRHPDGGQDGGVGADELHVGLVGAGGVGLDDGLGDDAAAGDALGVVGGALGHGSSSWYWACACSMWSLTQSGQRLASQWG